MRSFDLKNLCLSVISDVAEPGKIRQKSIKYYDPNLHQLSQRRCIDDYDFEQRRADAVLLRELCKEYYNHACNAGFIAASNKVMLAMNTLHTVAGVLTPERSSEPLYRFMVPYSQPLISQAAIHISSALDEAHPGVLMNCKPHIEQLYDTLLRLARDAEKRYYTEVYSD